MIRLIAAIDDRRGVANEQGIPWHGKIPRDTKYFRDKTAHGVIVMGYGSYVEFDRPLHDRTNFVVDRPGTEALRPGFEGVNDVASFLREHANDDVWIIGGAALFATTIADADELLLTQLQGDFHCTKFFPTFSDTFDMAKTLGPFVESDITFRFETWRRATTVRTERTAT